MLAMEVILESKKKFNISMEEFVVLLNVQSTFGLGYTNREFIGNLEAALEDEVAEGSDSSVCGFTLQEKEHLRSVISKFSRLSDFDRKKINDAIEKAEDLFNIFYFFNPLDRVHLLEPFKEAVMLRLNR